MSPVYVYVLCTCMCAFYESARTCVMRLSMHCQHFCKEGVDTNEYVCLIEHLNLSMLMHGGFHYQSYLRPFHSQWKQVYARMYDFD